MIFIDEKSFILYSLINLKLQKDNLMGENINIITIIGINIKKRHNIF